MKKDDKTQECCEGKMKCGKHHFHNQGGSNAIYGMGVVGVLFYFLQGASGLGMILTGIVKAIFWPAILIYNLMTFLKI